jgi:hypothetical protein
LDHIVNTQAGRYLSAIRGRPAAFVFVLACFSLTGPDAAHAACNLIPGTEKTFNSTLGTTNRPYAAPGETIEVKTRSCDGSTAGLSKAADAHLVTVAFPDSGATYVLTAAPDCTLVDQKITNECGAGAAICVPGSEAGLEIRNPGNPGKRRLRFRFPDSDDQLGTAIDDVTLAGPARIAVTFNTDSLPCSLATSSCAATPGLRACIDDFFANDGSCGKDVPLTTFPGFTALPPPNPYAEDCFRSDPPCAATATELRGALDAAGNLLIPIRWDGILVKNKGVPVPRLMKARIGFPVDFSAPSGVFLGSFTPEGGPLPPIFEPQEDPDVVVPNTVALFGSADAPYTILRLARQHGTCSAGSRGGERCSAHPDCPGGLCEPSGTAGNSVGRRPRPRPGFHSNGGDMPGHRGRLYSGR